MNASTPQLMCRLPFSSSTLNRAPVGQGPSGPDWLAIAFGFWSGRALATGTAWAGLCLIHHHHHAHEADRAGDIQSGLIGDTAPRRDLGDIHHAHATAIRQQAGKPKPPRERQMRCPTRTALGSEPACRRYPVHDRRLSSMSHAAGLLCRGTMVTLGQDGK